MTAPTYSLPLSDADRLARDADASTGQRVHRDREAAVDLAEDVGLLEPQVVEDQLDRGGAADAGLLFVLADLQARRVAWARARGSRTARRTSAASARSA